jgi:hypothetical protein
MAQQSSADDAEEIVGPVVAALVGILLTGLLYLLLPTNVIIGPNWLLLVIEGVFVIPLLIDILTPWDLSHMARRVLVLVPLSLSTLSLAVGVALFVSTLATNTNANNLLRAGALLWALIFWSSLCGSGKLMVKAPGNVTFPASNQEIFCFHNRRTISHNRHMESTGCRISLIICSSLLPVQRR